ncbi:hypothetical protein O6H91_13G029000 [Diphasiastrum complanatum]|uniref:Uncharacterized protein n=1 Tax=Diphasiastrum complanatum TaxID=34168 RepID=A0ACC2BT97_DIPCM|nr:hypothetical protein O6H91_Y205100 [Diphasiastrum complanatum]KAJ7533007.1 hypothetical protein O6H91_13G029000 [Diphasiastrum complanatum]
MKGELMPGLSHSLELIEAKEEKQKVNTSYPAKTDEGEVSFQNGRDEEIDRSRLLGSVIGNRLKRNADLASQSPLIARPSGGKDRHSKVNTAKGPRDRRVRLSVSTAIQFYDVQDRLGYDQPSKAVEWLMKKAETAIDELPPPSNQLMQANCSAPSTVFEPSPSFLAPSFATQQLIGPNLTAALTTITHTPGLHRHSSFTTASASSESENMRQTHEDLVPKFTSAFGNPSGGWADSEKVQRMAIVDAGLVGYLQGYPSAKTESRTKARERARERAKGRSSVKVELMLPERNQVKASTEGIDLDASSSPVSSQHNQILTSFFPNEDVNSRILQDDAQIQRQSYLNQYQERTSVNPQDSMHNVFLSHARPGQARMGPLPVSPQFPRPHPSFFQEYPAQTFNPKSNSLPNFLNRAFLQGNNQPSLNIDPAGFHTSSPRSSSFLTSFSPTHIPSYPPNSSAAASASVSQMTAFGIPLHRNTSGYSLTENDNSSLIPGLNAHQSAFLRTANVVGGYHGRYNPEYSSLQRVVRSHQKILSNEYDLLNDMLITSQGAGAPQSFNLASGILQEQVQSISSQFAYSASPKIAIDAYSHDYEQDSRIISNSESFRSSTGTQIPARFEGMDEIEEQLKRSS